MCKALRECQIETGGVIPACENSGVFILSGYKNEMGLTCSNLKILYSPTMINTTLIFTKHIEGDYKMTRVFEDRANEYVHEEGEGE